MLDFCLVGAGFIGPVHAANIAARGDAALRWVVDLNEAAGSALARRPSSTKRSPIPRSAPC